MWNDQEGVEQIRNGVEDGKEEERGKNTTRRGVGTTARECKRDDCWS